MNSISKILMAICVLLSFSACYAQKENVKTESVKIFGNCEMCKNTIEKAGNVKKVVNVSWDKNTKMAMLTYDSLKTNQDEILKRIALAGYDSEQFLAPDDAYAKLDECCRYARVLKPERVATKDEAMSAGNHEKMNHADMKMEDHSSMKMDNEDHSKMKMDDGKNKSAKSAKAEPNQLKAVFDNYFAVKDALVQTDGAMASAKSKELLNAINAVKMEKLPMDVHNVWMKILKDLKEETMGISSIKDAAKQRNNFMTLSKNIYALMKVSKYEEPVYYQFCPMANNGKGANWLSKDNTIKNPYYGSMMMTCGKTVETLK
jgi:copper chaperone CopZ